MKILLVSPQPFFEVRGTPLNVLQMVRALTDAGHEVHLATYPIGSDVDLEGLHVHRSMSFPGIRQVPIGFSKRKLLLDMLLAVTVVRLLLTQRFGVVHAVEEAVFFSLPVARARKVPVIYDLDSSLSEQLAYGGTVNSRRLLALVRLLERMALSGATCALTVCRSLTESVRKLSPGTPIFQIEDTPVDATLRPPDPDRVDALTRTLGLHGRQVLVYTGNFEHYQGIDLVLQAVPRVKALYPKLLLLLIGGNPEQVAALQKRAAESGISDHVHCTGALSPEKLPEYFALADGLLSPRTEGQNTPLKIFTYMHASRVIIATNLPTHTQVLDESTAVLVQPDAHGIADGIISVLRNPKHADAVAHAARERVDRDYSVEAFRRKLSNVYAFVSDRANRDRRSLNRTRVMRIV